MNKNSVIRIGTRGSKLALWQAYYVAERLEKSGLPTEVITIETKGDRILDVSIDKIGSKGVFTEELEHQLSTGKIDVAVHSAKDLSSDIPDGFELITFTEREKVNDVLLSHKPLMLSHPGVEFKIGTSSTRRTAILKRFFPGVTTHPVRGNLQTRIRKMEEGQVDALLLAFAGVHRMQYDHMVVQTLSVDQFIPPAGQGSIALETGPDLPEEKIKKIRAAVNHINSEICIKAERSFLKRLQGGCSIPVFAHARLEDDEVIIKGGIISLDGEQLIQHEVARKKENHEEAGLILAEKVLKDGGDKILAEIKALK